MRNLYFPGYVQGMSDLVAPLLEVLEDEALTFWCFKLWMDEMVCDPHSFTLLILQ